jgi:hypothetical protein
MGQFFGFEDQTQSFNSNPKKEKKKERKVRTEIEGSF